MATQAADLVPENLPTFSMSRILSQKPADTADGKLSNVEVGEVIVDVDSITDSKSHTNHTNSQVQTKPSAANLSPFHERPGPWLMNPYLLPAFSSGWLYVYWYTWLFRIFVSTRLQDVIVAG